MALSVTNTQQPQNGDIRQPGKGNYIGAEKQFPTTEDKQLSVVMAAFQYSRSFYSYRYLKFRQWLRLYHRIPDRKPPFRSNLFVPLSFQLVNTVLPRLVANDPTFRFEPRRPDDAEDEQTVEQMASLVKYQLDKVQFLKKLKLWVKDCLMFGVGIGKLTWLRDDREKVKQNDINFEIVDLLDFFPDPKAVTIDSGDFMIHRSIVALSSLRKVLGPNGKPLYKNLDKILDNTNEENSYKMYLTNDRQATVGDIDAQLILGTPYRQSLTRQVEILEYWGIFGDSDEEYVITVANRSQVIRFEKNPYPRGARPFVKLEIDPNNFLFFGTGLIDPVEHIQNALNDTRNQRYDNVNLILNKLFLVLRDANVNEQDLISRPGGVIYQDVPGGVSILDTPDITSSAYQEEAILKQDAQETLGISDIINGQLTDATNAKTEGQVLNRTATGAQLSVEQAGSRFKYYLQHLETSLEELGKKMYEYNQEFLSEEKVIRVEAPSTIEKVQKQGLLTKIKGIIGLPPQQLSKFEWIKIHPDALKNLELDVKVESGSTQPVEESIKQNKVMNLIGMLGQLPVTTPQTYMMMAELILDAYNTPRKTEILKTLQVPQQQPGPKASVSVSLKGDLNDFETADIAKMVGASPQSTDPQVVSQLNAQKRADDVTDKMIDHHTKLNQMLQQTAAQQNGNTQLNGSQNIPPTA